MFRGKAASGPGSEGVLTQDAQCHLAACLLSSAKQIFHGFSAFFQLRHQLQAGHWAVTHKPFIDSSRPYSPPAKIFSPDCCRTVPLKVLGLVGTEMLIMHPATQHDAGWTGAGAAGIGLAAALAGVNVAVSILINQYFHALFRIALQLKVRPDPPRPVDIPASEEGVSSHHGSACHGGLT